MEKSAVLAADIKKLDMEAFARISQWMVLKDIFLVEAKIVRNPLIKLPKALSLDHKCDTNFLWSEKNKFVTDKILCNFQVAACGSKSPDEIVMKIKASFCSSYIYNGAFPYGDDFDDRIEEYYSTICPLSDAWPYWREFVQNMSARMGFPALTVPLLEIEEGKYIRRPAEILTDIDLSEFE